MTDRAQPGAIDSVVRNYELGDALGQFSEGWVVPASEPTASAQRSDLDETAFTAFDQTSSSSSLTVTIGPGEAFVDGWLATDTSTDVDLAASTAGQTVGVSWDPDAAFDPDTDADRDAADRVVVALEGDVSSVDPFLALWTFDTDGSGVMGVVDERDVGSSVDPDYLAGADIPAAPSGEFLRKTSEGLEFAEIVAGATVQETEPSSPDSGELWYDPDSGIFKVYADNGSGADWIPVPSVQVLEEASTFAEGDVTLNLTDTVVENGSVRLRNNVTIDDFEDGDITIEADGWSGWSGDTGSLDAQTDVILEGSVSAELTANDSAPEVSADRGQDITDTLIITLQIGRDVDRSSDSVEIDLFANDGTDLGWLQFRDSEGQIYWFNGSYQSIASWTAGTNYTCQFDFDFANDQLDIIINGTNQGTFNLYNSVSGFATITVRNTNTSFEAEKRSVYFDNLLLANTSTSGNVLVEWDSGVPTDIESYDLATFQRSLDGETVTVDVEDGSGNVLFSDIGADFDISTVDTSKNVKLRANLSRTDTANNPTLDYAARRYTR